ncbi:MAG: GMC family oxidoreductase [Dehalococcoidia bacterium]|nr:GMC family oxidoreductase [Dehalococcoidia bacterium]
MKTAIVVGSGAGGATVARELQGAFQVTVVEAGTAFKPFTGNLHVYEKLRRGTGLFANEKRIEWLIPAMRTRATQDGMVIVRGVCHGGSTTLSTGTASRQDRELNEIGIDLDTEFLELAREIPINTDHEATWHTPTQEAFSICREMGLEPQPTPKMLRRVRCVECGRCILGCAHGAKWDSREFLNEAIENGAELASGHRVREVVIEDGRAIGVLATSGRRTRLFNADLVVLAAGGLGTPVVLQQSGIECDNSLFVDPVFCVATRWEKAMQNREIPMPFMVQQEHFMMSPYFDFLSFFFNPAWRYPAADIFSLMIKLADTSSGSASPKGVRKPLLDIDRARLEEAVNICKDILHRMGTRETDIFLGTLNAGHPGGTLPLTERESQTLHRTSLPDNLYVADASLLPRSLGNPPILTIMALAKKVSKACLEHAG